MSSVLTKVSICGVVISGLALTGCQPNSHQPKLNPKPKHSLLISGRVPASMAKALQVDVMMVYNGVNRTCFIKTPRLGLLPPYRRAHITVYPNAQGRFQAKLIFDRYQSGKCQWQPVNAGYIIRHKGAHNPPLMANMFFVKSKLYNLGGKKAPYDIAKYKKYDLDNKKYSIYQDWRCKKQRCTMVKASRVQTLLPTRSYHLTVGVTT